MSKKLMYQLLLTVGLVLTIVQLEAVFRTITAFPVKPFPYANIVGAVVGVVMMGGGYKGVFQKK